ncbi:MAG: carbohydrate-binding domain-containing protein [Lachnospiraceae bacterium]
MNKKNRKYKIGIILTVLTLFMAGCTPVVESESTSEDSVSEDSVSEDSVSETMTDIEEEDFEEALDPEEKVVELDIEFAEVEYKSVDYVDSFNANQVITCSDGDDIYITSSGVYEFTGDYTKSAIVVDVDKDSDKGIVYLLLNNANISSETGTPINILEAKDVVILLVEGSENTITQGAIVTEDEDFPGAAIYSKADTVIAGTGSLEITTLYNDAINSRDDLILEGVSLTISAVGDGIVAKDYLAVSDVTMDITAGGDGMKATNDDESDKGSFIIQSGSIVIVSEKDALSAANTLQIDDGDFTLTTGGGYVEILNNITVGEGAGNTIQPSSQLEYSMKALKSYNMIINGGTFVISSYEDAIHANNELLINGGDLTMSTGDDAVHADVQLTINDVVLYVEVGYEGIEAQEIIINGGEILVVVLDDAVNGSSSDGYVEINDGYIYLYSRGDGLDSNGDLTITGGTIILHTEAVYTGGDSEVDVSGTLTVTGGTIMDEEGNEIDPTQSSFGGMNSKVPSRR